MQDLFKEGYRESAEESDRLPKEFESIDRESLKYALGFEHDLVAGERT